MTETILIIGWLMLFSLLVYASHIMHKIIKKYEKKEDEIKVNLAHKIQNWVYVLIVAGALSGVGLLYYLLEGTIWQNHVLEWLDLAVRWIHITFGIAWIGASFYFVFLENALNRTKDVREELAGNLWAVHGGGFYYLEKYKLAPKKIPKDLHWFKYEAYFTWLSGFSLLTIVYYFNASSVLVDPEVLDIQPMTAIALGIGSLAVGWIIYDQICKRIKNNMLLFSIAITIFLIFFAWFYSHVFNGRAAFIHFGALIGTLMAANVFFVIIPGQKRMVNAAKKGELPNPEDGKAAMLRSYTNNYFTLPVLFVMISNHFPMTYGHTHQWLILLGITIGSAGIKHYLNLREKGELSVWVMPVSVIFLFAVAFATAPAKPKYEDCAEIVTFNEVTSIIRQRCMTCHSENPTDEIWKVAPNGVKFDTPEQIYNLKDKIYQQAVLSKNMPFNNNQTGITQEERDMINCWINQGAPK